MCLEQERTGHKVARLKSIEDGRVGEGTHERLSLTAIVAARS